MHAGNQVAGRNQVKAGNQRSPLQYMHCNNLILYITGIKMQLVSNLVTPTVFFLNFGIF